MIDLSQDIHSLSDFKRKTAGIHDSHEEQRAPACLDNQWQSRACRSGYGELPFVELAERAEMLGFYAQESRNDLDAGRTEPAPPAAGALAKRHKLNRKDVAS